MPKTSRVSTLSAVPLAPGLRPRRIEAICVFMRGLTVEAEIGGAAFTTALFAKDGTYFLPIKAAVRRAADIAAGDRVAGELTVSPPQR